MKTHLLVFALASMLCASSVFAHGDEKHEAATMPTGREATKAELSIAPAAADAVAAVERFSTALSAGDLTKASAELDPEVIILESGGVERSRDEYMGGHAKSDAAFLKTAMTTLKRRTARASGYLAWVTSESQIHAMKGKEMLMIDSTETMVLHKSQQAWKIVHIHWSSRRSPTASAKPSAALHQEHQHRAAPAAEGTLTWMNSAERQAIATGQGFAMARAAEAHGLPGPKHVLEIAQALALDEAQRDRMNTLMGEMHAAAVREGKVVLDAEIALDAELSRSAPNADRVAELSEAVGRARGRLRNVHLTTHLAAAPVLTPEQRAKYVQLRSPPGA